MTVHNKTLIFFQPQSALSWAVFPTMKGKIGTFINTLHSNGLLANISSECLYFALGNLSVFFRPEVPPTAFFNSL